MASPEYPTRAAVAAAFVAVVFFAVQFVTGQAVAGLAGVIALTIPGYLISRATLGPRGRWYEAVLVTIVSAVILTMLVGVASALTPRGLDAVMTAVFEHIAVTAILATWLIVARRGRHAGARRRIAASGERRVHAGRPDETGSAPLPGGVRRHLSAVVLVSAGVLLAAAAIAVSVAAVETQAHAGYLELSSVASRDGSDPMVVVRNGTGGAVSCALELTRAGQVPAGWSIDALADGSTWLGRLPEASPGDQGAWLLALDCTDPSGATLHRRLQIDPPASAG